MHVPQDSMWWGILKTFWFSGWTKQGLVISTTTSNSPRTCSTLLFCHKKDSNRNAGIRQQAHGHLVFFLSLLWTKQLQFARNLTTSVWKHRTFGIWWRWWWWCSVGHTWNACSIKRYVVYSFYCLKLKKRGHHACAVSDALSSIPHYTDATAAVLPKHRTQSFPAFPNVNIPLHAMESGILCLLARIPFFFFLRKGGIWLEVLKFSILFYLTINI